jgi:hypothetical protein
VLPPKRSQVQIQRGVGYVYLRRLYQSNRWAEEVSYTNLVSGLAVTLKIDYYYYYYLVLKCCNSEVKVKINEHGCNLVKV